MVGVGRKSNIKQRNRDAIEILLLEWVNLANIKEHVTSIVY